MGRELEEGLIRTPIIQRNSDRGGKEKAHVVERLRYQPLHSCVNSRPGELIKQKLQPLRGRHRVLDQENREFSSRLVIDRKIRLYSIEMFDM